MGTGAKLGWAACAFFVIVPLNWIRIWIFGDGPPPAALEMLSLIAIFWAIGGAIAYALLRSAKAKALQDATNTQELLEFKQRPLVEISPQLAILKPNERSYGAIRGELYEIKTVGYSAGTAGISVRVAKGVTIRSGAIRGKAEKGMVSVSSGELVVTNQRIIFSGDRKSFAMNNSSLLNITNHADGLSFSDAKTSRSVVTGPGLELEKFVVTLGKALSSN